MNKRQDKQAFRKETKMESDHHGVIQGAEKIKAEQSLVCLLHACKGYTTTVELRDESSILGKIENVDGFMNIIVSSAQLSKLNGNVQRFDELFVQGSKIRFVHIPDEIDMRKAIKEQLKAIENTRNKPTRKPPRKGKRR